MVALLRDMGVQMRPGLNKNSEMKKGKEMEKRGKVAYLRLKCTDKSYAKILKQPFPLEEEV